MRIKLILALLAVFLISPVYADTLGGGMTGSQINCATSADCPYGYTCPQTYGGIAQCQSISGQDFRACYQNSECQSGQICARTPPKTTGIGSCQTCAEHWALKQTGGSYCWQDSSNCGTQYDLRQPVGFNYPVCQTQQSQGCIESWICGAWTTCQNGQQDRGCTDLNGCGTVQSKPAVIQTCQDSFTPPTTTTSQPTQTAPLGAIQISGITLPTWFLASLLLIVTIGVVVWALKKKKR